VFVTALPHGISKEVIPKLVEKGKRIVDHSGDFRYKSVEVYEKWYNATHGMPHLLRRNKKILALAPLVKNRLVDTKNDAASGVSGAGRKSECDENFKAYSVSNHRHTSEIEQELSLLAEEEITVSFTPHLSTSELIELYKEYYKNEYFVRILDEGIGLVVDKRLNRVVILSAIDNLGKGAAGQAVQVLNILFGLPEHRGLTNPGFYL